MPHPQRHPKNEFRATFGPNYPIGGGDLLDDQTPLAMLREGQVLDKTYRIVRLIGEGGMGVVYEATHARLAGRYAIKVLVQRLSDNAEAMARFDREARITSSLQHPNIVQVIDFNRHADGTEYLVMEYLQGETLAGRLSRGGALAPDTVAGVVEQIAAGLAAAHSHGVVHRDLKPENIFLLPVEGRRVELVKVLDFGISKVNDANRGFHGPESSLMGTPEYMSPEQCRGRPADVDAASDQFALAVITYQMLTGRTPFSGDSVGTVLSRVLYDNPPAMGIDPEVERVVRRGLAKSKRQRFISVTAFAEALRGAAMGRAGGDGKTPGLSHPVGEIARGDVKVANQFDGQNVVPRRSLRGWGAVLFTVAAVSVTLFFVSGSNRIPEILPIRPPLPIAPHATRAHPIEVAPIGRATPTERVINAASPTVGNSPSPTFANATSPSVTDARPRKAAKTTARKVAKAFSPKIARAPSPKMVSAREPAQPAPVKYGRRVDEITPSTEPIWRPAPVSGRTPIIDDTATLPLDENFGEAR